MKANMTVDYRMRVNKLELENFRGFASATFNFHPKFNVLVGKNGCGKSTALDAMAISMSWLTNRIRNRTASGRPITENDIKNGQKSAAIQIEFEIVSGTYNWGLNKFRWAPSGRHRPSDLSGASTLAEIYRHKIVENNENCDIPTIVYYPVNRSVLDIPLRIRNKHKFDLLSAYEESLTSGANFRIFFEWFREREDLENENIREDQHYRDYQLEAVRLALSKLMPNYKKLRVLRNPLRMVIEKNGENLVVNQLSDGEKCLMALTGDLARRLAIANPTAKDALSGTGIVLIDEIDLHLHPGLQRKIVETLPRTFPNCQFIVSTHSPHVISHCAPESVFLVDPHSDHQTVTSPSASYGQTADRILQDLMGFETTRPEAIQKQLDLLFLQISNSEYSSAETSIEKLESLIGDDPELTKARTLLRVRGLS